MKKSIFATLYDHRATFIAAMFIFAIVCVPFAANAGTATAPTADTSVPWTGGLKNFTDVISGPTALLISMVGLFFAGGILIFGGELGNFTRMIMMIVLVGSTLTGISNLVIKFVPKAGGFMLF